MKAMIKNGLLVVLLAGSSAVWAASAGDKLIDGSDPKAMLEVVKGHGNAELTTDNTGDPLIEGRMNGNKYRINFYDCTDNRNCKTVMFQAAWAVDKKPTLEKVMEWNREKRFGQAYLDEDKDPVLAWDVNLTHGVSRKNWDDTVETWGQVMGDFAEFFGY